MTAEQFFDTVFLCVTAPEPPRDPRLAEVFNFEEYWNRVLNPRCRLRFTRHPQVGEGKVYHAGLLQNDRRRRI